jgi:hypothetical protein
MVSLGELQLEIVPDDEAIKLACAMRDPANPGRARQAAAMGTRWLDCADQGALSMSDRARHSIEEAQQGS